MHPPLPYSTTAALLCLELLLSHRKTWKKIQQILGRRRSTWSFSVCPFPLIGKTNDHMSYMTQDDHGPIFAPKMRQQKPPQSSSIPSKEGNTSSGDIWIPEIRPWWTVLAGTPVRPPPKKITQRSCRPWFSGVIPVRLWGAHLSFLMLTRVKTL